MQQEAVCRILGKDLLAGRRIRRLDSKGRNATLLSQAAARSYQPNTIMPSACLSNFPALKKLVGLPGDLVCRLLVQRMMHKAAFGECDSSL